MISGGFWAGSENEGQNMLMNFESDGQGKSQNTPLRDVRFQIPTRNNDFPCCCFVLDFVQLLCWEGFVPKKLTTLERNAKHTKATCRYWNWWTK